MSDMDYDDDLDGGECWQCGGEGRVNDCIDGCCSDQDDPWCRYCSKRCDICNPVKKLTAANSPQDTTGPEAEHG